MKNLEKLLHTAKPDVPDLPDNFSQIVLQRIVENGLSIQKSPALNRFRRTQLGLGLVGLATALILFNFNSYELRMNGSLELLFFGSQYLNAFIGFLPWDLIVPSLALTGLSAWFFWKSGFLKKGIAVIAIISYLITGVGGVALATTSFNDQIEKGISKREKELPWLNMFHHHRAKTFIQHPNFKMGKVQEINNGSALVITPNGEKVKIQLPETAQVQVGQILRMSGQGNKTAFAARNVHVCNPNRVNRYFGSMAGPQKMMMKSCCSRKMMKKRSQ